MVDRLLPFNFEVTHAPGRVLGFADYLSRHPSELQGATIQAEKLWNDWFTVNTVSKFTAISGDTAKATETPREKILTRAKDSVLKVENEKERKVQASDEKQDTRQPIKTKHGRVKNNAAEISGAYNLEKSSVIKFNMSEAIYKINEAILPANYEADKQLQKIIALVKTREGGKISETAIHLEREI